MIPAIKELRRKLKKSDFFEFKFNKANRKIRLEFLEKIFKKLQFVNSKSNVLVQMADMIAGSIHRKYQINKTDARIYYAVIKKNDPLSRLVVPDTLPYGNSSKSGSLYFYYNIKKFLVKFIKD